MKDDTTLMTSDNREDDGPSASAGHQPKTRRCVTAYDDCVPVAWADVPYGEPDPKPMYLSTTAANIYFGLDQGVEATIREEGAIVSPADVELARRQRRMRICLSGVLVLISVVVMLLSIPFDSPLVFAQGGAIAAFALPLLVTSLTDSTHFLLGAILERESSRRLALPGARQRDSAMGRPDIPETPSPSTPSSEGAPARAEERPQAIRERLLSSKATLGRSEVAMEVASLVDEAIEKTKRAEGIRASAMTEIGRRFPEGSLSWRRFAYGVDSGYERVLDNSESIAKCMDSLGVLASEQSYGKIRMTLERLVTSSEGILVPLEGLPLGFVEMTADEATSETEPVVEYLQELADDIPKYRLNGHEDGMDEGSQG